MVEKPAEAVFNEHRSLLFSIAYRMVGTAMEAEDILQEAYLRWQRAPRDEVARPKSYLWSIVTRLSIDYLRSARQRREEYIGPWLPEPLLTDAAAGPEQLTMLSESLSTAFLVLLEQLKPVERAVFLLREVFDYDYATIAEIVGKSEVNCRQLASRARKRIAAGRPRFEVSAGQQAEAVERFLDSVNSGDVDGLLAVLAPEASWTSDGGGAPGIARRPIRGTEAVVRFVLNLKRLMPQSTALHLAQLGGKPGIIIYVDGQPFAALTFRFSGPDIHQIYAVANPEKLSSLPPL